MNVREVKSRVASQFFDGSNRALDNRHFLNKLLILEARNHGKMTKNDRWN